MTGYSRRQFFKQSGLLLGGTTLALGGGNELFPVSQVAAEEAISTGVTAIVEHSALPLKISPDNPAISFKLNRCERCGDCRRLCEGVTTVCGHSSDFDPLPCIYCGQCTLICQGQALTEKFTYPQVQSLLKNESIVKVAAIAPSLRVSIGELFGQLPGTDVEGKLIGALKKAGFDYVFDTSFGADVTVMEEATELLERLDSNTNIPLFTSCCPGWLQMARLYYPQWLDHISTVKSPFMIEGALIKSWFAKNREIDPRTIAVVALAPCTGKKFEIKCPPFSTSAKWWASENSSDKSTPDTNMPAWSDVDFALTTRETAHILKSAGITQMISQPSQSFDSMLGKASGAALLFGQSGGVTEAALRTAYWLVNDAPLPDNAIRWLPITGIEGGKSARVDLGKRTIRVAVIQGAGSIRLFLNSLTDLNEEERFDFVELMACPGGCIGGGGQPRTSASADSIRNRRAAALFKRDQKSTIRTCHENPELQNLYQNFIEKPGSRLARELLHRNDF